MVRDQDTQTVKQVAVRRRDQILLFVLLSFLLSDVLDGAIRYTLANAGLTSLVYLPKTLLALMVVAALAADLARGRMSAAQLGALALLAAGVVHGYLVLGNAVQVAFGLWVLIPFLGGIVALPALLRALPRVRRYAFFLWAVAVGGVLINVVHPWPWIGLEYGLGGVAIEGSRLWGTEGLVRLPGFSRASFEAANQILLLAAVLLVCSRGWRRLLVWLLSGVSIALTTSKTPLLAYLVLTAFCLTHHVLPRYAWRLVPVGLATLCVALPLSTLLVSYDFSAALQDPVPRALLASLGDRLESVWPETLAMVVEDGNVVLGRGVGGIGMAHQYFGTAAYSPADNLGVYLYALFGILGLGSLVLYGLRLGSLALRDLISLLTFVTGLILLLSGLSSNVLESPVLALVFGANLRYALSGVLARLFAGPTVRSEHSIPARSTAGA